MSKLERIAGIGKSGLVFHSKPSISSEEIEKVIKPAYDRKIFWRI
jgi:hypothetical protein